MSDSASTEHAGAASAETPPEQTRADLLDILGFQRWLLLGTVEGISDEQARQRSTVSELTLGGVIKHLVDTENGWMDFVEGTASSMTRGFDEMTEADWAARADSFTLLENESLAATVAAYQAVAERTDALVRTVDLDEAHPLPAAPWFPPGAVRSNRRVFLGMVSELAQHSGHADIIREAIDGKKSMG